jgi:hypothetical protein
VSPAPLGPERAAGRWLQVSAHVGGNVKKRGGRGRVQLALHLAPIMDSPTPTGVGPQIRVPRLRETLFGFQAPLSFFLLSATYQPLPLNTMPAGWMSRRTWPSHSGQRVSGSAVCFNWPPSSLARWRVCITYSLSAWTRVDSSRDSGVDVLLTVVRSITFPSTQD